MSFLNEFQPASPSVAIKDPEVILISDDDTDNSDDEYEFEDVLGTNEAAIKNNQTPAAESGEDGDVSEGKGIHYDATSVSRVDTNGVASALASGPAQAMGDDRVSPKVTPRDDTEEPEWVVHDEGDDDSRVEAVSLDRNAIDSGTPAPIVEVGNTVGDLAAQVAAQVATLHNRVAELEAQLHLNFVAYRSKTPSRKRKRSATTSRRKVKAARTVNISATRAYVYWDESPDLYTYTWKRGRTGHSWVSDEEGERGEEFYGECLLCSTSIAIEVRANGDWLPIMLRFDEDTEMFEGQASLGSRRLGVDCSVVIDMMSGGQGEHVASVLYG